MSGFIPRAEYIERIDILSVELRDSPVARTLNLSHWRNIDLNADGQVVAAEFINVTSEGIDLTGVPESETVARLIRDAGLPFALTARP